MRSPAQRTTGSLAALALLSAGPLACTDRAQTGPREWPAPEQITGNRLVDNCVVLAGELKCWARHGAEEGDADALLAVARDELYPEGVLPAVDFGEGAEVLAVESVGYTRCAVIAGRGVKCWGDNDGWGTASTRNSLGLADSDLRLGDTADERGDGMPFVALGAETDVVDIGRTNGAASYCVVYGSGRVKCWGAGLGVLGLGDAEARGDDPGEMGDALPYVDLGAGVRAVGVSGGLTSHCVWTDEGRVKCWGNNARWQLGFTTERAVFGDEPMEMGDALPALDLGADFFAVQVSVGWEHACALSDDGRVKCWGANATLNFPVPEAPDPDTADRSSAGRLGLGDDQDRSATGDELPYVELGTDVRAVAVAASALSTCAVTDDARLKCWGPDGVGDLDAHGDDPGEMGDALPYVDLGTDRTIVAFSRDDCALLDDDSIKCWGIPYPNERGDALAPILTRDDLFGPR
jgi:hypothetical protein